MKIVIFSGGTGSTALQTGLYEILDRNLDGVSTTIITNAYDNGKSTGDVRRVMGGHILGPSDVRKNQTTRLRLQDPSSPWLEFLDIRFSKERAAVKGWCLEQLEQLRARLAGRAAHSDHNLVLVKEAIEEYFAAPMASKIDYTDFSLANIIYAGFARANKNSLRKAAQIMSSILGIPDCVILNSDESLFLSALTRSGKVISDEGEIVSWGNMEDPFVDVFFTDAEGYEQEPVLSKEARAAIIDADLIILSSGTQWSSLIPTYATQGFREAMMTSRARVIMVMNRQPDRDSPGQGASEIVQALVPRFFDRGQLNVILSDDGHPIMRELDSSARELVGSVQSWKFAEAVAGGPSTCHSAPRLAAAILQTYFDEWLHSDHFMFDYDDTLVGRGNSYPRSSAFNTLALIALHCRRAVSVCSGNGIKAVNLKVDQSRTATMCTAPLKVFADGGVNLYQYDPFVGSSDDAVAYNMVECVQPTAQFDSSGPYSVATLRQRLRDHDIPLSKIENRGNCMLCVKPIDEEYRGMATTLIKYILRDSAPQLQVRQAGRSSIEIYLPAMSKSAAVKFIFRETGCKMMTYVGDELYGGNDEPVYNERHSLPLRCLAVTSPTHTAAFLLALNFKIGKFLN